MKLELISVTIQIIGVIGVILTLIYLAKQVKDNTRISAATIRQSISESMLSNVISFFSDQNFRKLFNKHLENKTLDPEELIYIEVFGYYFFRNFENIHYQFRAKMLSKEDWLAFRKNLKALCQIPALREFWKKEHENFNHSFLNEVNQILKELTEEPTLMPDAIFQPKNKPENS